MQQKEANASPKRRGTFRGKVSYLLSYDVPFIPEEKGSILGIAEGLIALARLRTNIKK